MEKVIAVVITFNRQALLAECITALRNQTRKPDAILVINNSSTDITEQPLSQQSDLFYITQKNTGGAGGFSTGIATGYKKGYSWIWCMDDDGYPKEDALEKLLEAETNTLSLRNCAVINKVDKKTFVWKTKNYATIDDVDKKIIEDVVHPFNGTLIHRNIVERVGVPNPDFFLWGDETEYYYRIKNRNDIQVFTVANSIHYHPPVACTYKSDWDYKTGWKMYYYIRNRLHVNHSRFHYKFTAFISYSFFILAMSGIVLIYQKTDKLKKLSFILWPAVDAFRNDLSASPSLILSRLNQSTGEVFRNSMVNTFKAIRYYIIPQTVVPKQA